MKNSYLVCIKLSRSIEKILRTFLEMKAKWNLYPSGHRFQRFFTCLDFQSFSSFTFSLFCYFFFNFSLFKNKVNKLLKFKIWFQNQSAEQFDLIHATFWKKLNSPELCSLRTLLLCLGTENGRSKIDFMYWPIKLQCFSVVNLGFFGNV